jgi:rod shape-determining protein MreD
MVRKVRLVLCIGVLFLLQAAVVHRFSYHSLRPDLLLIASAYLALEADYRGALWSGFAIGLLRDLGSTGRLGAGALLLVPACAALALLREHLVRESFLTDLVLAGLFLLAFSTGEAALDLAFVRGAGLRLLLAQALGQTAFSIALVPLVFAAMGGAGVVDRSSSLSPA